MASHYTESDGFGDLFIFFMLNPFNDRADCLTIDYVDVDVSTCCAYLSDG